MPTAIDLEHTLCPLSSVVESIRFTPDERWFDSTSGYSQTGSGMVNASGFEPDICGFDPHPVLNSSWPRGQVAVCKAAYAGSNPAGESHRVRATAS